MQRSKETEILQFSLPSGGIIHHEFTKFDFFHGKKTVWIINFTIMSNMYFFKVDKKGHKKLNYLDCQAFFKVFIKNSDTVVGINVVESLSLYHSLKVRLYLVYVFFIQLAGQACSYAMLLWFLGYVSYRIRLQLICKYVISDYYY